jgi:hypothetical protein
MPGFHKSVTPERTSLPLAPRPISFMPTLKQLRRAFVYFKAVSEVSARCGRHPAIGVGSTTSSASRSARSREPKFSASLPISMCSSENGSSSLPWIGNRRMGDSECAADSRQNQRHRLLRNHARNVARRFQLMSLLGFQQSQNHSSSLCALLVRKGGRVSLRHFLKPQSPTRRLSSMPSMNARGIHYFTV